MRNRIYALLRTGVAIWGALLFLMAIFALISAQRARAANYGTVLISEIMYDPAAGYGPGYGPNGEPPGSDGPWEWVELYNPGSTAVDIGGWKLTDEENYPTLNNDYDGVCTITTGTTIPAGGFLIVAQADISADLPPTVTLSICDAGSRPVTQTFEMGRDGIEVLALLDDADHIVAGSLDYPFPDMGGQNAGQAIGLRYPAYGWSKNNADWAVESTVAASGPYRAHTAGKANTGWTWPTTPHTLTASINGTVVTPTEWSADGEYLGKVDDVEFYLTWDAANLYAGFSGQNALTGTYIVALDTDPLDGGAANSGTTAALCGTAAFSGDHKPDYAIQAGPGGLTTTQAAGGAWSAWTPATTNGITNGLPSGQAEFQIAFSGLGLTYGQPLGAYLFVCDASAGAVRAAWPPENVTASSSGMLNTGLDVALVLQNPGTAQAPRYEASRMGVFTVPLTTTSGDYHLWDGYMWFYVITPTTSPTGCSAVVRVMGNRLPTSQGAPSRRAYQFNADTCPGMSVNLDFSYEAGDSVPGKVQTAPNELLGMNENRLTLSRWDGSAWQLMPSAAAPPCTFSTGTWHCPAGTHHYDWNTNNNLLTIYNVSTFSTWTFSDEQDNYNPTAVTLAWVRARPAGNAYPLVWSALTLLGGAWLLGRGIRRRQV
ncbi:MAG: hypothetical protein Fur0018_06700 [Anaerolineales bacterium]